MKPLKKVQAFIESHKADITKEMQPKMEELKPLAGEMMAAMSKSMDQAKDPAAAKDPAKQGELMATMAAPMKKIMEKMCEGYPAAKEWMMAEADPKIKKIMKPLDDLLDPTKDAGAPGAGAAH